MIYACVTAKTSCWCQWLLYMQRMWTTLQSCRFAGGLRGVLPEGEDAESESAMLGQEEALLVADRLHLVLRPFMLRRLKLDVAADLPQKVHRTACNPPRSPQLL
jgi:hypothetical protein